MRGGGSGSGRQPVFLHDPSVARRDISGRRLDTRAGISLSREISDPRKALRCDPRFVDDEARRREVLDACG
jgi:hypothetical protein